MKGVVFNLLEEVVSRDYGQDAWDQVLDAAGLDGSYTSLGGYPDDELFALIGAASTALDKHPDEIVRWFGREALPLLAANYPQFFELHESARPFVLTLNDIIHPEVRKLYPGAEVPVFDFATSPEGGLLMGYSSARKLCSFAEGLIEAAADHYGEKASIEQLECMKRGDQKCLLQISFETA